MKLKSFLIIIYAFSSLIIASFTALMTYIIIDEPIGIKMFSKISLSVLLTLPMIIIVSYLIGKYLSGKFNLIKNRLDHITIYNRLDTFKELNTIDEIKTLHHAIDLLASRLEETIASLEKKNNILSQMMISFSHDVKTPLTIINGYLEEIEDGLIPSYSLISTIGILKKETRFINEMTVDIITYLQSLHSKREKECIHLKELLENDIVPLLKSSATVTVNIDIADNFTVDFNYIDIKKTLFNLLHNSTKFTQKGYIKIYAQEKNIIIEDTGIGIPSHFKTIIFDPFTTVDTSKNREHTGFGLGLSISSNLASNNGYQLSLNTDYTHGSQFILRPIES